MEQAPHEHKPLTMAQNIVLTIKVLIVIGLIGGALWTVDRFVG